ncbi:MAG: 30S ribosomal protein S20 [Spirochaetaceae bacterium]|nr:MAG: 30S ribosomal protein S20 [Spirochaetaceae bacterium]
MSNSSTAAKRHRQNIKRRLRNRIVKSELRTNTRRLLELVQNQSKEDARKQYVSVASLLDRAVSKGVIHKNTAARKKHRLQKVLADKAS